MRKGVSGVIVLGIVGLFILGLSIAITQGSAGATLDFSRAQSVNLQAERITNAMLVMETVPEGHIELRMDAYQIKYDEGDRNLSLNYSGQIGSKVVEEYLISYDRIVAPSTFKPINGSLCIQKEYQQGQSTLTLNRTGCEE